MRFEAQSDAVTTVFQTTIDLNPENTVGIAGKGYESRHTPILDIMLADLKSSFLQLRLMGLIKDLPPLQRTQNS